MGNATYQSANTAESKDDDLIVAAAAQDPRIKQLLADPATRAQTIKRIKARNERIKAGEDEEKVEQPWQAEVNGVPTGSTVHYDDDNAITSEVTEKKHKTTLDKKPGEKLSDATVNHARTTTVTNTDGENKDVHEATNKVSANKKDGITLGRTTSDEQSAGEDASVKNSRGATVTVGPGGGKIGGSQEKEVKLGGTTVKESRDGGVSLKDGKLSGDYKKGHSHEDEKGTHDSSKGVELTTDEAKLSFSKGDHKKVKTDDGKEVNAGTSHDGSFAIGKEGVKGDYSFGKTNDDGSSRKTSASAEIGKDKVAAEVGHEYKTKGGTSVKASAKAGVEVHADDPVKVGNEYVVHYTRTKSYGGSAGGGKGAASVTAGGSHEDIESGTRTFKTEDEAKKFKEHAAEMIHEQHDPETAQGAMEMAVGESRGHDVANGGNIGGSLKYEGASASASAYKKSNEGVEIKRVSDKLFEVTVHNETGKGHEFGASGNLVTLNQGGSSKTNHGVTMRFDLTTPEGKKAYEQFCKNHQVPAHGGELVQTEDGKEKEHHDGAAILGNTSSWGHNVGDDTVVDKDGKHEKYWGKDSHDNTTGWIGHHITGDKDLHSSTEVISRQENDKNAGYTLVGKTSGESGKYNRGKLQHLWGRDENWDESKVKPSGEWTMSADIDEKTVQTMIKYSTHFKGTQGNNDKQMQALSDWVSEDGMDAVNQIEQWSRSKLAWDLELKGDTNFPGRAGREGIDQRTKAYAQALSQSAAAAPGIVPILQGEITNLQIRRANVADLTKYTDLPTGLRNAQLTLIDNEISAFQSVLHRGLIETSKTHAGEDLGKIGMRANDKHGYDKMSGAQKELAEVRDQIALQDSAVMGYQKNTDEARAAMRVAVNHLDFSKRSVGPLRHKAEQASIEGGRADDRQKASFAALDQDRLHLTLEHDDQKALGIARGLLDKLKTLALHGAEVSNKWLDAAKAQVLITKPNGLAPYKSFWDDVMEGMETADFEESEDFRADAGIDNDDDDEPKTPAKKTSMALPESRSKKRGHG